MKFLLLLIAVQLVGCASVKKVYNLQEKRVKLFPTGYYKHRVRIQMPEMRQYQFYSHVRLSRGKTQVTAVSPLGISLFRIQHFKPGAPKVEVFISQLQKYKPRIVGMYQGLSQLFSKKLHPKKTTIPIKLDGKSGKARNIRYDKNEMVDSFRMESGKYKVEVKVREYEVP